MRSKDPPRWYHVTPLFSSAEDHHERRNQVRGGPGSRRLPRRPSSEVRMRFVSRNSGPATLGLRPAFQEPNRLSSRTAVEATKSGHMESLASCCAFRMLGGLPESSELHRLREFVQHRRSQGKRPVEIGKFRSYRMSRLRRWRSWRCQPSASQGASCPSQRFERLDAFLRPTESLCNGILNGADRRSRRCWRTSHATWKGSRNRQALTSSIRPDRIYQAIWQGNDGEAQGLLDMLIQKCFD